MPESNASLGPWCSPLAPACVRIGHVISNPPHSEKFQYPVELNTLIAFRKLCVILETGTLGSMQRVSYIPLQRLTSSPTLLQLLASIISIFSISWETQRIIHSLSVLLSAGLNDRENNSNRMKEHRTLKSQGMKPVNEKKTIKGVLFFMMLQVCYYWRILLLLLLFSWFKKLKSAWKGQFGQRWKFCQIYLLSFYLNLV